MLHVSSMYDVHCIFFVLSAVHDG